MRINVNFLIVFVEDTFDMMRNMYLMQKNSIFYNVDGYEFTITRLYSYTEYS